MSDHRNHDGDGERNGIPIPAGDFVLSDVTVNWDCPCGSHNSTNIAEIRSVDSMSTTPLACPACRYEWEMDSFMCPAMPTIKAVRLEPDSDPELGPEPEMKTHWRM